MPSDEPNHRDDAYSTIGSSTHHLRSTLTRVIHEASVICSATIDTETWMSDNNFISDDLDETYRRVADGQATLLAQFSALIQSTTDEWDDMVRRIADRRVRAAETRYQQAYFERTLHDYFAIRGEVLEEDDTTPLDSFMADLEIYHSTLLLHAGHFHMPPEKKRFGCPGVLLFSVAKVVPPKNVSRIPTPRAASPTVVSRSAIPPPSVSEKPINSDSIRSSEIRRSPPRSPTRSCDVRAFQLPAIYSTTGCQNQIYRSAPASPVSSASTRSTSQDAPSVALVIELESTKCSPLLDSSISLPISERPQQVSILVTLPVPSIEVKKEVTSKEEDAVPVNTPPSVETEVSLHCTSHTTHQSEGKRKSSLSPLHLLMYTLKVLFSTEHKEINESSPALSVKDEGEKMKVIAGAISIAYQELEKNEGPTEGKGSVEQAVDQVTICPDSPLSPPSLVMCDFVDTVPPDKTEFFTKDIEEHPEDNEVNAESGLHQGLHRSVRSLYASPDKDSPSNQPELSSADIDLFNSRVDGLDKAPSNLSAMDRIVDLPRMAIPKENPLHKDPIPPDKSAFVIIAPSLCPFILPTAVCCESDTPALADSANHPSERKEMSHHESADVSLLPTRVDQSTTSITYDSVKNTTTDAEEPLLLEDSEEDLGEPTEKKEVPPSREHGLSTCFSTLLDSFYPSLVVGTIEEAAAMDRSDTLPRGDLDDLLYKDSIPPDKSSLGSISPSLYSPAVSTASYRKKESSTLADLAGQMGETEKMSHSEDAVASLLFPKAPYPPEHKENGISSSTHCVMESEMIKDEITESTSNQQGMKKIEIEGSTEGCRPLEMITEAGTEDTPASLFIRDHLSECEPMERIPPDKAKDEIKKEEVTAAPVNEAVPPLGPPSIGADKNSPQHWSTPHEDLRLAGLHDRSTLPLPSRTDSDPVIHEPARRSLKFEDKEGTYIISPPSLTVSCDMSKKITGQEESERSVHCSVEDLFSADFFSRADDAEKKGKPPDNYTTIISSSSYSSCCSSSRPYIPPEPDPRRVSLLLPRHHSLPVFFMKMIRSIHEEWTGHLRRPPSARTERDTRRPENAVRFSSVLPVLTFEGDKKPPDKVEQEEPWRTLHHHQSFSTLSSIRPSINSLLLDTMNPEESEVRALVHCCASDSSHHTPSPPKKPATMDPDRSLHLPINGSFPQSSDVAIFSSPSSSSSSSSLTASSSPPRHLAAATVQDFSSWNGKING